MALTKEQKKKIVEDLREKIKEQKAIIFVAISGVKVKDLTILRKKLKEADDELKVAKKTLLGIILKEAKLKMEAKELLGEIAVVFGYKNELSPAKTVYQFAESNPNVKILGGFIESQKKEFLNAEQIVELAKLPTKEELLGRLVGSISAPVSGLVNVLQGNLRNLAYLLSRITSQTKVNQ